MASFRIRGYPRKGVEIREIVDAIKELVEEKAQEYGIEKVFINYKKMLNVCPEIDVVSICTPSHSRV